jgi:outer membrane immunogenic protein
MSRGAALPSCRREFGGSRMKKLTFASVAVMALAAALQPAGAADTDVLYGRPPVVYAPQPAVVIFTWTGFYFGVHGGGGWGHTDVNGSPYSIASTSPAVIAPPSVGVDVSGWLAGGQIGANYQAGSWVVGAEADVSGANLTGSTTCISTPIVAGVVIAGLPLPANCSVKVVGLGTIAGRLGFALDRTLVYGKGGAAWANYKYDLTADNACTCILPTFSGNETKWGWMLGAGVEYAFFDNWSAKIEYNYLAFSTSNHQFTGTGAGQFVLNTGIQQQLHLVKAGINYRWGWAPVGIRY